MTYRQLPAFSPLSPTAITVAARTALSPSDPRDQLKDRLLRRYSASEVALYSSGTHALTAALRIALATQAGPVLLPGYTCYEVATAAIGAGATVALYDVDPDTLSPDWDSLRRATLRGAAAIVVASLYGEPIDWRVAREVARESGAMLIEDAAQAHGSTFGEAPGGSFGDLAVLSFGRGKGWTGIGGGALLARRPVHDLEREYAERARPREEGAVIVRALAQWLIGRPALYGLPARIPSLGLGETRYRDPKPLREMSRASASLILENERSAFAAIAGRRRAADEYRIAFGLESREHYPEPGEPGAIRFPLRVRGGWKAVSTTSLPALGVAPPYPTTLAKLPPLEHRLAAGDRELPGAERLVRELVTLPTHAHVRRSERRLIIDGLANLGAVHRAPHPAPTLD